MKGGGGCEFKGFTKGVLILRPKSGGVNSVSGENLHDFEIISPAGGGGCERTPPPSPPSAYGPVFFKMFNVKSQRVIFPRYSALV